MNDDRRWLDEPRNVTRIVYGLVALCTVVLLAGFFVDRESHFAVEDWPGFYAVYGFVVSVALVLSAKQLRRLVRRDEDYYEQPDETGESGESDRDGD